MSINPKNSTPYSTQIEPVQPRYLDTKQAARYLGLANSATLALWRRRGYGPPFVPVGRRGGGRYLYDKKDLDEWVQEQKLYPQRPHALESYTGSGSLSPSEVNAKKPRKIPKKQGVVPLHKVFRTVSEDKPDE